MNQHGQWIPDPLSPSGFRWQKRGEQPVTVIRPAVQPTPYPREQGEPEGPEHPGGDWANADAYASYDEVDSCTIIDTGAP